MKTPPSQDAYILGPGDTVMVELLDVPEYSGNFTIGPDGTIYLPRLRSIAAEGLTIEELRFFLTKEFSAYVHEPQVFVSPSVYRPIRVYIGGEVQRPGYYYLSDKQTVVENKQLNSTTLSSSIDPVTGLLRSGKNNIGSSALVRPASRVQRSVPTSACPLFLMHCVLPAESPPSPNWMKCPSPRKLPNSSGGRKMRAKLNFLELITDGNETQNIRLFDGDTVVVSRSPIELREQIIKAGQTNLSPAYVEVYVSGRVRDPGSKVLPQGATLDQALASAGGQKLLRGQVEFIRFNAKATPINESSL